MYLGVDYYPEQWDYEFIEKDLARMADSNINCIRIAEFAWHLMEPSEGVFNFDYFAHILVRAKHFNINVILGTPTATLPAWMAKKYPDMFSVNEFGIKRHFGGRRQACLNTASYLEKNDIITEKMAHAYKEHTNVVGWQIDNELGHETSDWCYCDHCEKAFQKFLKEKFQTIQELNERLGTIFWSQSYNDFSEIELPKPTIPAQNPGLFHYLYQFRAQTIINFVERYSKLLRKIVPSSQIITHNYPGDYYNKAQNFTDISEHLDVVSLNNYPVWGGLEKPIEYGKIAMKLDQTRGFLKGKLFWITEQLIGAQSHTMMGYLPRPNQARLWSWQALLHGCNHLIYFRWRTATKGAEQFCYGVLDQDNQNGPRYFEMKKVFEEAIAHECVLNTPIVNEVALLYDPNNIYAWKIQPQSTALDIHHEHFRLYQAFQRINIGVDVIDIKQNISKYKIILLPVPMLLTKETIEILKIFVQNGGTIISSFRAGIKDSDNSVYFNQANPWLELAGVKAYYIESLATSRSVGVQCSFSPSKHHGTVWRDMLEIVENNVTSLFNYTDEFADYSACTKRKFEKGEIIHIGTGIDEESFWIELAIASATKHTLNYTMSPFGVEVIMRGGKRFILNHNDKRIKFEGKMLNPYDVSFE
ncbi:MAG: beta-galactosidase [Fusobacteria bacterium]|nr:beta-galactosidase [Fusobacteriota bacterium]